ncbi:MAG: methylmalonyl Co-A mutase-associated GTPase MeaB, partial [Deltaproteobacteria bacterium]|nr:methylmalonyl Co-A mutase-associated GTPase MeaB [Deltaproteobacteria bacterium]
MERLSIHKNAFIRPSPAGGTLGGVASRTRETMLLCEAAGFDVVIVETVGVGQSETVVSSMVDFFLVLMISGAGDELQGIKKGVLEMADAIAVNKADGDNIARAKLARKEYEAALQLLRPASPNWRPPVLTCSAREMTGIDTLWEIILEHREIMTQTRELEAKRKEQNLQWLYFMIREGLEEWFYGNSQVKKILPILRREVERGRTAPTVAVKELLSCLFTSEDKIITR